MSELHNGYAKTITFTPIFLLSYRWLSEREIPTLQNRIAPLWQRRYIGTMILLLSHSPSVKSVAGIESSFGVAGKVELL